MSVVTEKYMKLATKLAYERKTGYECEYCGNTQSQTNLHGTFCAGCGRERALVLGTCFGVPVTDKNDVIELMREENWFNANHMPMKPLRPD